MLKKLYLKKKLKKSKQNLKNRVLKLQLNNLIVKSGIQEMNDASETRMVSDAFFCYIKNFLNFLCNKKLCEDRTAADKKMSQERPAAGVESCRAGFFFSVDWKIV